VDLKINFEDKIEKIALKPPMSPFSGGYFGDFATASILL